MSALVALSLTMNLPPSRALSAVMWVTGAPALLSAELIFQYLHQLGCYPAPPAQPQVVRFCVLSGAWFVWVSSVFAPVLFGVRFFGGSLRVSQGFALLIGSVVAAYCYDIFVYLFGGSTGT